MKIAIVGSSHLSESEMADARKNCGLILNEAIHDCAPDMLGGEPILISGGAKGVDSIAEEVAKGLGIERRIFRPVENNWDAYKVRNLLIAQECDILYCFPTRVKTEPCYHCNATDHERSGACWTMKKARELKKEVHLIPLS